MSVVSLGRLEKVDVRDVWTHEAGDFTPWLASDENLALLGDTIGIDLELEAQEQSVGPFRADILCKDTVNDTWVLIENQLAPTDHSHLGQLLTYAAGLHAVTIVWIADRFTDQHRAALDWLNTITAEGVNFFGLEIEAWRIGSSDPAPKFNIVSQPNDWSKTVSGGATGIEIGNLTETQQAHLAYWSAFRQYMLEQGSPVKPQKAQPQHWMYFAMGRGDFRLSALLNTQNKSIGIGLEVLPPNAKPLFYLLQQHKAEIEDALGTALEWQLLPERKQSNILLRNTTLDPTNRDQWPLQQVWLKEKLESFRTVFGPRIKTLDTSAYVAAVTEDTDSGTDGLQDEVANG